MIQLKISVMIECGCGTSLSIDQEVQSHAFVAETSNVYCGVVVGVDVEGGLCSK